MSKCEDWGRQKVTFDVSNQRTNKRSFAPKCVIRSNAAEKSEHQGTTRVKFKKKENFGSVVNGSQNVQFVRNTQQPVRKSHSVVHFTSKLRELVNNESKSCDFPELSPKKVTKSSEELKLHNPELCTSLRFANKLLEEAVAESKTICSTYCDDVSSSKTVNSKILRNVNIPFDEHIYKDLVDLKVSEDDLFIGQDKRFKPRLVIRTKESEPDLSEFYKPSFNEEFIFKADKVKFEAEKVVHYDGFSISDRMKNWDIP